MVDGMKKRHLVVIAYPNDWHWVLSLEYTASLLMNNEKVDVLDLSLAGENLLYQAARTSLRRMDFIKSARRYLNSQGLVQYQRKIGIKSKFNQRYDLPAVIDENAHSWKTVYPSLAEACESIRIDTRKHLKAVRLEIRRRQAVSYELSKLDLNIYESIATVNGRFTKNYEIAEHIRKSSAELRLIEFGSTKDKYQVYKVSPHSMAERALQMQNSVKGVPFDEIKSKAKDYFKLRRKIDPSSGISWTGSMSKGLIPQSWSNKKILTLFSSSQREFLGVQDPIPATHFQSQMQAFKSVALNLIENSDWIVVLRLHPRRGTEDHDDEGELWRELSEFPNVHVVSADSPIDSYELGSVSQIVMHFNSSIGPELIFAGHKRVVTLGPTFWNDLSPDSHIQTESKLAQYLKNPWDVTADVDVSKWAYFMGQFGVRFRIVLWDPAKQNWKLSIGDN